jgi:hypothetical protein
MNYEFKKSVLKEVGTSFETIYTTPAGMDTLCVALNIANIINTAVQVTVELYDSASTTHIKLLENVVIPVSSALPAFGRQKHILNEGDYIRIKSSAPDSVDAVLSFIEDINNI